MKRLHRLIERYETLGIDACMAHPERWPDQNRAQAYLGKLEADESQAIEAILKAMQSDLIEKQQDLKARCEEKRGVIGKVYHATQACMAYADQKTIGTRNARSRN